MLQAIGLTSTPRQDLGPAVDDLTFEAGSGQVTALLGTPGSGKTTALRLMLELEPGRGVTCFRGRPLHRIAHPAREVGTLLGDVPGHPARTARSQLRMLCAAAGVPASRADDLLEVVGLAGLGGQRLGTLSLGMDRRLGLAAALLADPHTLLLDAPSEGLSPRENSWLHGLLRGHAAHGGTVLYTTRDPKEAARTADRVLTIDAGRLVADQDAAEFARTRLRPRVAVRTPHTTRLAALIGREARETRRSVEVVAEGGSLLSVYGSSCAEIGDTAFRHSVLIHQLADETGPTPAPRAPEVPAGPTPAIRAESVAPPLVRRPARGPLRPVRYELRRLLGVRTAPLVGAAVLLASAVISVLLARTGGTPLPRLLAAWPRYLPLPPAAFGAGLLGALAFGDEFRYPALAAGRGTVPRRLGLLAAKLAVSAGAALLMAALVVVTDAQVLRLLYGGDLAHVPPDWEALSVSWGALVVGCAWAGLLAAGVFRSTSAGLAAVLAVPVLVVPLVQKMFAGPSTLAVAGLPGRLRDFAWISWPYQTDRWLAGLLRLVAQPVGAALALSLSGLLCAYLLTGLRGRARW
ncbi:ATP-binding cassette domain-containing protein [Streptomyces beijiangensis]|uniref:ATP-binding cassette domain-containing protein n=1 Tax=Streptomyces beijiangensis TaxID=163361 RepID=A0A939JKE8_9ACTN|nr:ATP-binding cassette domain-containing protein [Streptomyces beijiangensis]MBO0514609.1 ATP-binding cassette domain-containing protein [Streptomyces beijiangensis]